MFLLRENTRRVPTVWCLSTMLNHHFWVICVCLWKIMLISVKCYGAEKFYERYDAVVSSDWNCFVFLRTLVLSPCYIFVRSHSWHSTGFHRQKPRCICGPPNVIIGRKFYQALLNTWEWNKKVVFLSRKSDLMWWWLSFLCCHENCLAS